MYEAKFTQWWWLASISLRKAKTKSVNGTTYNIQNLLVSDPDSSDQSSCAFEKLDLLLLFQTFFDFKSYFYDETVLLYL